MQEPTSFEDVYGGFKPAIFEMRSAKLNGDDVNLLNSKTLYPFHIGTIGNGNVSSNSLNLLNYKHHS